MSRPVLWIYRHGGSNLALVKSSWKARYLDLATKQLKMSWISIHSVVIILVKNSDISNQDGSDRGLNRLSFQIKQSAARSFAPGRDRSIAR